MARTYSVVVIGVKAHLIEVEAHLSSGLPGLSLIGLPDAALNEARDRVKAAILSSGLKWPSLKMVVGLSPAWLPKRGSGLDVAIALAILAADGQIPSEQIGRAVALGELGLDGRIRPVAGALAAALAIRQGRDEDRSLRVIAGPEDASQLRLVPDLKVQRAVSLRALVARLRGEQEPDEATFEPQQIGQFVDSIPDVRGSLSVDLIDVKGQEPAKFALQIAAAGGHHLAMLGRAGVGKTLLAERMNGLLPPLEIDDALEVTAIHQMAAQARRGTACLIERPPWYAPHHTASRIALVGGGSDQRPSVGIVSLAHRGVLFLDEAAEFDPSALDALREPLEAGCVSVARANFRVTFPARFQLILASNPCPCGNALDEHRGLMCRCTPHQRRRYVGRLSGPLLDRIDLRVLLTRPTPAELGGLRDCGPTSAEAADRIRAARERGAQRLAEYPWRTMGEVPPDALLKFWSLPPDTQRVLDAAGSRDSIRGRHRVVRVSWTIADLSGHDLPTPGDVAAALELRATTSQWAA